MLPITSSSLRSYQDHSNKNGNDYKTTHYVELTLSRSTFISGSSLLGTVRLVPSFYHLIVTYVPNNKEENVLNYARRYFLLAQVYVAGRINLDTRWNTVSSSTLYGLSHPYHSVLPNNITLGNHQGHPYTNFNSGKKNIKEKNGRTVEEIVVDSYYFNDKKTPCICFYSTNVVTLWDASRNKGVFERGQKFCWDNWNSVPVIMENSVWEKRAGDLLKEWDKIIHQKIVYEKKVFEKNEKEKKNTWDFTHEINIGRKTCIDITTCSLDENKGDNFERFSVPACSLVSAAVNDTTLNNTNKIKNEEDMHSNKYNITTQSYQEKTYLDNTKNHEQAIDNDINYQQPLCNKKLNNKVKRKNSGKIRTENWRDQLVYTFRVDLPEDLPPTLSSASTRYFYSAVLLVKTYDEEFIVIQAPFTVVSKRKRNEISIGRKLFTNFKTYIPKLPEVQTGVCRAYGHSNGPPVYISPSTRVAPSTISFDQNHGLISKTLSSDVRSLNIKNINGTHVCMLTIIGAKSLSPGGKIILQFDFPISSKCQKSLETNDTENSLPCFQVSALLHGEEICKRLGSSMRHNRTRCYHFDSECDRDIYPGFTRTTSLTLLLPLDAPSTSNTDFVHVNVNCRIDLFVGSRFHLEGYDNLSMNFPLEVIPYIPGHNKKLNVVDNDRQDKLEKDLEDMIMRDCLNNEHDKSKMYENDLSPKIITRDLHTDFKMLTLNMLQNSKEVLL